jgi:DNA-binding XRE family transcriptional regulator
MVSGSLDGGVQLQTRFHVRCTLVADAGAYALSPSLNTISSVISTLPKLLTKTDCTCVNKKVQYDFTTQRGRIMTLQQYFAKQPHGSVSNMARQLGVSRTWLSLVANGHALPSPILCVMIERLTKGNVKRKVLRPDLFE